MEERLKTILEPSYSLGLVEWENLHEELVELETYINNGNSECMIPKKLIEEAQIELINKVYYVTDENIWCLKTDELSRIRDNLLSPK